MLFSDKTIELIKSRSDILEIVSKRVKLYKKGSNYFGLCPFHTEKTPSFSVNVQKQTFTCFGCGESGDCIEFVKKTQNLTFQEAIEYIASIYAIPIQPLNTTYENKNEKQLKELHNYLVNYYKNLLFSDTGEKARKYLEKRGIDQELCNIFSIGFCYDKDFTIYNSLLKSGFSNEIINISGVFNKHKIPMLIGRIILPIFNEKNDCVGFGGRTILQSDTAKYINSPETLIFKKRKLLYNANIAFKQKTPLIITEGYFDVISMYKKGIKSVVAPLGTAISEEQIDLCWKHCPEPIVAFDGDNAGNNAAFKLLDLAIPKLSSNGRSFKFLNLPKDKDLDNIANDPDININELINSTTPMHKKLLEKYHTKYEMDTPEQKALLFNNVKKELSSIKDSILRSFYFDFIKENLFKNANQYNKGKLMLSNSKDKAAKFLFAAILLRPEILEFVFEKFSTIKYLSKLRDKILTLYTEGEQNILEKLKILGYDSDLKDLFSNEVLLHTSFIKNLNISDVAKEWDNVYFKHFVEKQEELVVSSELKEKFSTQKWELLKHIKRTNLCL